MRETLEQAQNRADQNYEEIRRLKAERDSLREDLEFVHKALAWEERRCGRLYGVLGSAIDRTRARLAQVADKADE